MNKEKNIEPTHDCAESAVIERLWDRVILIEGCLFWNGKTSNGYASANVGGKSISVNRCLWEALNGAIPDSPEHWHVAQSEERLFARLQPVPGSDCLVWTGSLSPRGYGRVRRGTRTMFAHRVAYEIAFGDIPPDYQIHHSCGNPRCCNPEHLVALSPGIHLAGHAAERVIAAAIEAGEFEFEFDLGEFRRLEANV